MFFDRHPNLHSLSWPASRVGEAIEILARKTGFLPKSTQSPLYSHNVGKVPFEQWIDNVADQFGLEAEAIESLYVEVEQMLLQVGPAILRLPDEFNRDGEPQFLALLKGGWLWVTVITPDLSAHRIRPHIIKTALCQKDEAQVIKWVEQLLVEANISEERWERVQRAILREQLSSVRIDGCWLLRLPPSTNLWLQVKKARLHYYILLLIALNVIGQLLNLAAWWIVGRGALQGHFEWALLLAWALVILSGIPFQLLMIWIQCLLAVGSGVIFKQRLLYGTLRLEPEEIRHQGVGQFLGRVMEAEAVELMALSGGFTAIMAIVELVVAMGVLTLGAGGVLHAVSLLSWSFFTVLLGWRYFSQSSNWVNTYREMTNELVERMVGHRTRLAQQDPVNWHQNEDEILARYFQLSERLDKFGLQLSTVIPRGWLISGFAGIAYTFMTMPNNPASIAISLGGVVLASQAITRLVGGISSVIGFMVAWDQVRPLFEASTRPTGIQTGALLPALIESEVATGDPMIDVRDIVFRYHNRIDPVLYKCRIQICKGDRLLLEGPSGGGKSTLATILVGLRTPESGLLLLRGLDQQTIGLHAWRQRIISAPQFHENHVLTETFAFNLLMGRNWPPSPKDLEEAEMVCRELGLGELLDHMPAGLQQMVGESGWQLSHGERSRLFIARALLQKADLIVLDESFASLDPENLYQAMQCVLNRATTVLVIAHP
jgi:ATP-binding cassette subfamily B protein